MQTTFFPAHGRLAGTDEERLHDLQTALDETSKTSKVPAGDYGMLCIVPQEADYSIFQGNPNGDQMNDITVLHAKLHSLESSLHAFMPSDYNTTSPEVVTQLRNFLFGIISSYAILHTHQLTGNVKQK